MKAAYIKQGQTLRSQKKQLQQTIYVQDRREAITTGLSPVRDRESPSGMSRNHGAPRSANTSPLGNRSFSALNSSRVSGEPSPTLGGKIQHRHHASAGALDSSSPNQRRDTTAAASRPRAYQESPPPAHRDLSSFSPSSASSPALSHSSPFNNHQSSLQSIPPPPSREINLQQSSTTTNTAVHAISTDSTYASSLYTSVRSTSAVVTTLSTATSGVDHPQPSGGYHYRAGQHTSYGSAQQPKDESSSSDDEEFSFSYERYRSQANGGSQEKI